jgi:hypothetical protein
MSSWQGSTLRTAPLATRSSLIALSQDALDVSIGIAGRWCVEFGTVCAGFGVFAAMEFLVFIHPFLYEGSSIRWVLVRQLDRNFDTAVGYSVCRHDRPGNVETKDTWAQSCIRYPARWQWYQGAFPLSYKL